MKDSTVQRFWDKVEIRGVEDCWRWRASYGSTGYGQFCINRKPIGAHRVSYELSNGPIENGLCVLHRCDNRFCVNPSHLFLGTRGDNNRDKAEKGRAPRGWDNPATKLSEAAIEYIMDMKGVCSQTSLAKLLGVSQQHVSYMQRGKKR